MNGYIKRAEEDRAKRNPRRKEKAKTVTNDRLGTGFDKKFF